MTDMIPPNLGENKDPEVDNTPADPTPEDNSLAGTEQPGVTEGAGDKYDVDVVTSSMGNAYQGQENLDKDDPESAVYDGPETEIEKEYTYATYADPARQADPNGVYLDDLERNRAEVVRAKIEGREPDLDNPPAYGGDVILTKEQAAKTLPGDFNIPVVKTLPVNVGNPSEDEAVDEEETTEN